MKGAGKESIESVVVKRMLLRCVFFFIAWEALTSLPLFAISPMSKDQLKAVVCIEAVTVPSPGEFFAAVDKQGQPNWTQLFQLQTVGATSNREQMALMLGVLVADGYMAVEAQDGQGVKNTGKEIIELAKKLNVSQSILSRGSSINDFAENNNWSVLREELEATQNEVKLAMAEQRDQDLVILVTIGAWIRGVEVASKYIGKNYSPALAKLLRQPAIVDYLLSQTVKLPENMRSDAIIQKLQEGLKTAKDLVQTDSGQPLSEESVHALSALMANLVTAISEGSKNS